MTINHIDQLAEWWENAEQGIPREGDTYIARFPGGDGYETGVVDGDGLPKGMLDDTRILARSTKPKPAWRDAVAVIAHTKGWGRRRVFTRHEGANTNGNRIWSCGNLNYGSDDLIDPAPLIEAEVTDEMVQRGAQVATPAGVRYLRPCEVREVLNAALGIEVV